MSRKNRTRTIQKTTPQPVHRALAGPAVILLAAFIAVWPLMQRGPSCGADFAFHFVSWTDAQGSMAHGIPYPHWAASPNFGAGEPRFVFYPPLTWMIGAFLGVFVPWAKVSIALAFLLFAGTGFAHRALAREILADGPAVLAGCASIFLGNLLLDTYMRSDYAELAGGVWIPLLLLFLLRKEPPASANFARFLFGVAPLSAIIAGIWLTNGPLGIMSGYLLVGVVAVSSAVQKTWTPAIRAGLSLALGLGLASVYLLPAVWERGWVNLHAAVSQREYLVENGWLFHRHADPTWMLYDTTLDLHSWLAVFMLLMTAICMLIAWGRGAITARPAWWIPLALIPPAVLLLQLPISAPLWKSLPALQWLQFPWRWLVVMIPSLAIAFAAAVWVRPLRGRLPILAACTLAFIFISGGIWGVCYRDCGDLEAALQSAVQQDGTWGKPEYSPTGIRHPLVDRNAPKNCEVRSLAEIPDNPPHGTTPSANAKCRGGFTQSQNSPEHRVFSGTADHDGFLILNLRSYPAWRITRNGLPIHPEIDPEYGLVAVPIQQGPVQIVADWTTTSDVWAGRALTGLVSLLLILLCVKQRRRTTARLK